MKNWNAIADDAYRAEITRAEVAGEVASENAAQAAAEQAVLDAIRKDQGVRDEVEREAARFAAQRAHSRSVDEGKRRLRELTDGQLCFADMGVLEAIVPLGEGMVSTTGYLNDERLDMADEVQRENMFAVQRRYGEWSDKIRRPVKRALRVLPPGSTWRDAVAQGKL